MTINGVALTSDMAFLDSVRSYVAESSFRISFISAAAIVGWSVHKCLLRIPANIPKHVMLTGACTLVQNFAYFAAAFISTSEVARALYCLALFILVSQEILQYAALEVVHCGMKGYKSIALSFEPVLESSTLRCESSYQRPKMHCGDHS